MKKVLVLFGLMIVGLVGCEDDITDKVNQGQACLDESRTPSAAAQCAAIVAGLDHPQAYAVHCSALFLADGINVSSALGSSLTGSEDNKLMAAMAYLAFSNQTDADAAYSVCAKAGGSFKVFAKLAQTATLVGSAMDPDTWQADLIADPSQITETQAEELIAVVEQTYCTGSNAESDLCAGIKDSNGDTISGACALYLWQSGGTDPSTCP